MVALIALGAGIGACLRYALTLVGKQLTPTWPMATLVINTLGALVAGMITGAVVTGIAGGFLLTGMCGGFTTFSTFMVDSVILLRNRRFGAFATYYLGTVGLGILSLGSGLWLGQRWF